MILPEKGITGIYKITSPSGKIYIGQSKCIRQRWQGYKSGLAKSQYRLNNSFKKYGIGKHKFEVIQGCDIEDLNRLERYYQDFYDCIGKNGLNGILQKADELPKVVSETSRKKLSETQIKNEKSKGSKNPKYTLIVGRNYETKEVLEMGIQEWADFLKCDRTIVRNNINTLQLVQRKRDINDWDLNYKYNKVKNKPINFGDLKIYLDIYTGIYLYGRQDLADYLKISLNQLRWLLKKPNSELFNKIKIV